MSIFVAYKDTFDNEKEEMWCLGDPKQHWVTPKGVYAIYADGDELEEIIAIFRNIVYPVGKRQVTWRGDIAKLIWEHI